MFVFPKTEENMTLKYQSVLLWPAYTSDQITVTINTTTKRAWPFRVNLDFALPHCLHHIALVVLDLAIFSELTQILFINFGMSRMVQLTLQMVLS